jgi:hypothetical protein
MGEVPARAVGVEMGDESPEGVFPVGEVPARAVGVEMHSLPARADGVFHNREFHRVKNLKIFYLTCCTINMEQWHPPTVFFILLRLG